MRGSSNGAKLVVMRRLFALVLLVCLGVAQAFAFHCTLKKGDVEAYAEHVSEQVGHHSATHHGAPKPSQPDHSQPGQDCKLAIVCGAVALASSGATVSGPLAASVALDAVRAPLYESSILAFDPPPPRLLT